MGLFDLLDEEEQKFATGSNEPTLTVSGSSSAVDVGSDNDQFEASDVVKSETDGGGWISVDTKRTPSSTHQVELYETKVRDNIFPDDLVWAPYYRYGDKLFPARLCANNEVRFEPWVKKWPLPIDEAVVEIFCQEKSAESTQLIIVKQNKLLPFWKRDHKDLKSSYEGAPEWNEYRLNHVHVALQKRHNKANSQLIFDKIKAKAGEFLEKALAYDAANADVPDQPPAPTSGNSRASKNSEKAVKVATPPSPPPKAAEPEGKKISAPMSPLLKSLLQVRNTPSKADMTLRVGDYISYSSREGSRVTRILAFTSNPKEPLQLEDSAVLHDTDLVKRLHPDPTSKKGYSDDTSDTKHSMLLKFSLNSVPDPPQPVPKSGKKRTVSSTDSDTQGSTRVVRSRK